MRVCQKAFQKLARDVDEGLRVAEEPDTRFVRHHHDLRLLLRDVLAGATSPALWLKAEQIGSSLFNAFQSTCQAGRGENALCGHQHSHCSSMTSWSIHRQDSFGSSLGTSRQHIQLETSVEGGNLADDGVLLQVGDDGAIAPLFPAVDGEQKVIFPLCTGSRHNAMK